MDFRFGLKVRMMGGVEVGVRICRILGNIGRNLFILNIMGNY